MAGGGGDRDGPSEGGGTSSGDGGGHDTGGGGRGDCSQVRSVIVRPGAPDRRISTHRA